MHHHGRHTFSGMQDSTREDYQVSAAHHGVLRGAADRVPPPRSARQLHRRLRLGLAPHPHLHTSDARRSRRRTRSNWSSLSVTTSRPSREREHSELAATILQAVLLRREPWNRKHHCVFQSNYFSFHHFGRLDRHARERSAAIAVRRVRGCLPSLHQNSFAPGYETLPLAHWSRQRMCSPPRAIDLHEHRRPVQMAVLGADRVPRASARSRSRSCLFDCPLPFDCGRTSPK